MKKFTYILIIIFTLLPIVQVDGQELVQDEVGNYQAKVLEVLDTSSQIINQGSEPVITQTVTVEFTNGPLEGQQREVSTDTLTLEAGDKIFINYRKTIDDTENFYVSDVNRLSPLFLLLISFCVAVVALGKWQGFRSLIALAGSFLAIFYVLLPMLLAGYSPVLVSTLVAALILFGAIYFTHGFNRESSVAFFGTMLAVLLTGILAKLSIWATGLTGLGSEDAVYLSFSNGANLDFNGLLLGSIIIGVLGVLDDIAVTQAAVVTELYNSNKEISKSEVFKRALRVGQEHVGALVNTLVLAYTSASLPLLLLFYGSDSELLSIINRELFASEIVRTIVGSIGLIMTVPIVTWLAVKYLKGYVSKNDRSYHYGHSHSH